ncbi:hypothetical protein SK128_009052, partial [Halocaridina rubra]
GTIQAINHSTSTIDNIKHILNTLTNHSNAVTPRSFNFSTLTSSIPGVLHEETVKVTHVRSPSLFFVQRSIDLGNIATLNLELMNISNKIHKVKDHVPCIGKTYLNYAVADGSWCRVLVTSLTLDTHRATVQYVDYGWCDTIDTLSLFECPCQYQVDKLPAFALTCSLWQILPSQGDDWDSRAVLMFTEFIQDTELKLLVIECEVQKEKHKYF